MTFEEFVQKHQIGPSMNQRLQYTRAGIPMDEWKLYESHYDGKVGDGWVPLLDELATKLYALGWDGRMNQIKEKLGGLRFYAIMDSFKRKGTEDAAWNLIWQAEERSFQICEDCGSEESVTTQPLTGRSWIRTLCQVCRNTLEVKHGE